MDTSSLLKSMGVKTVYGYIDRDPQKNLPKVLDWLERYDRNGSITTQVRTVREAVTDPENNWSQLIYSIWDDIDDQQRKKLFVNTIVNGAMIGSKLRKETEKKYDCNVPWAILMDPTSACNKKCIGCWAAEYGDKMSLTYEQLDDVICQGKQHGTFVYIYSGGEPLIRRKDLIRLCDKHQDCAFLAFTNGTLIDDEFADEMLRVGNFVPAISVEGFEEATDSRRGKGTYQEVMKTMERLRDRKLLFGTSSCYTSKNTEDIGSEEYFDAMIEKGAKFTWLFTYMPIGTDAVPDLLARPEQREYMYHQVRKFRKEKPIFTMDFWNDGQYVNGCIAGGRNYLHINANGDIEPCAFIHYSDSNIKEKTLLEAYRSPLFMAYRKNQPFNSNMLRPCPVLDNPGKLTEMVESSGAISTDMASPEKASEYCDKCVDVAEKWAPVADRLWNEDSNA